MQRCTDWCKAGLVGVAWIKVVGKGREEWTHKKEEDQKRGLESRLLEYTTKKERKKKIKTKKRPHKTVLLLCKMCYLYSVYQYLHDQTILIG